MKKLFLHIGLLFIITGISILLIDNVSASINGYYSDIKESKKVLDNININYNLFKEKSLNVKDTIKDISVSFDFYLEEFNEKNIDIVKKINKVEDEIIEISNISIELDDNCKYELNNKNIDNKCSNYKINYKNMMTSYNEMINVYNEVIDSYNEYQKELGRVEVNNYKSRIGESVNKALINIS